MDDLVLNRMITQFDIIMDVDMAQPSVRSIPTPHPTPPFASLDNIIRFADVYYYTTYAATDSGDHQFRRWLLKR